MLHDGCMYMMQPAMELSCFAKGAYPLILLPSDHHIHADVVLQMKLSLTLRRHELMKAWTVRVANIFLIVSPCSRTEETLGPNSLNLMWVAARPDRRSAMTVSLTFICFFFKSTGDIVGEVFEEWWPDRLQAFISFDRSIIGDVKRHFSWLHVALATAVYFSRMSLLFRVLHIWDWRFRLMKQ